MGFNQLGNLRILLVDDEQLIVRLVNDVLTHLGFNALTICRNGLEGMEQARQQNFDMIITDWRMPDIEGIELIQFIRRSGECPNPRVPIIMLTGNTETSYILRARDAGVTEYMIKPFSAQELARRIKVIIERPRRFVESPNYVGPDRRWHNVPIPKGNERRAAA